MWEDASTIRIKSRLQLFYFTALRGYRVRGRLRRPVWGVMDFTLYETTWMVSNA